MRLKNRGNDKSGELATTKTYANESDTGTNALNPGLYIILCSIPRPCVLFSDPTNLRQHAHVKEKKGHET